MGFFFFFFPVASHLRLRLANAPVFSSVTPARRGRPPRPAGLRPPNSLHLCFQSVKKGFSEEPALVLGWHRRAQNPPPNWAVGSRGAPEPRFGWHLGGRWHFQAVANAGPAQEWDGVTVPGKCRNYSSGCRNGSGKRDDSLEQIKSKA